MKKHNFGAGPCILPQEVFAQASHAIIDFDNSGLSILEISHRSDAFVEVMENARSLALELLNLENKGYQALFLQGGASFQFVMVAYNLLEKKAGYLNTGRWANNAIIEASNFGKIIELGSSADKNYSYIPEVNFIPENLDYIHYTSNNTIAGTQMQVFPKSNSPIVVDMSSDIYSRNIDYTQFDLIYAGAQKNIGPAGATLVIIKEEILGKVSRIIPSIMDYQNLINKKSMFNTPPVFSVYTSMLNLEWLKNQGGIAVMDKLNKAKADLLYAEIDRNSLFKANVTNTKDRSLMNVTFQLKNKTLENKFIALTNEAGVHGIKGHRSVGGYRASLYNALPLSSVEILVNVMRDLEKIS